MKRDFGYDLLTSPPWLRRWGPLRRTKGPLMDRASLHHYTVATSVGALATGAFQLGMVVLRKTLGASEMQLGVMAAIVHMSLLLGIFGGELIRGRDKRPTLSIFGAISRGAFLLFAMVKSAWAFIGAGAVFYCGNALMAPAVTTLWQSNISPRRRGALWGYTVIITTIIAVVTSFFVGWLLDIDNMAYRWIFPLAGIAGLLSIWILVRMPHRGRHKYVTNEPHNFDTVVVSPIRRFVALLRADRYFRHFELAFFMYGCAFMLMVPVLPRYMVDLAHMSYKQASIAEGVLLQLGAIGLSVAWGKRMDKRSPSAICTLVFALLALFPAILLGGLYLHGSGIELQYVVYLGYLVYGIGLSGMGVAWNLAPITFAGDKDASAYTGAHITLTGVRGAVAPITGALLQRSFGFAPVFCAALVLFLCASASMAVLEHRMQRTKRLITGT